jgi:hypothetical protein
MLPNPDQAGKLITCYGQTMARMPVLTIMTFPYFQGSDEDFLKSKDFEDSLVAFGALFRQARFKGGNRAFTSNETAALSPASSNEPPPRSKKRSPTPLPFPSTRSQA